MARRRDNKPVAYDSVLGDYKPEPIKKPRSKPVKADSQQAAKEPIGCAEGRPSIDNVSITQELRKVVNKEGSKKLKEKQTHVAIYMMKVIGISSAILLAIGFVFGLVEFIVDLGFGRHLLFFGFTALGLIAVYLVARMWQDMDADNDKWRR